MSDRAPNRSSKSGEAGGPPDMFVSPGLVQELLDSLRFQATCEGYSGQIAEAQVRSIATQFLSQISPASLSSF